MEAGASVPLKLSASGGQSLHGDFLSMLHFLSCEDQLSEDLDQKALWTPGMKNHNVYRDIGEQLQHEGVSLSWSVEDTPWSVSSSCGILSWLGKYS